MKTNLGSSSSRTHASALLGDLTLAQSPPLPLCAPPIVAIGAGAIVRDAHLPAYRLAGFSVVAVYDILRDKAEALARDFGIDRVCGSLEEAVEAASSDAVFDVAVPASAICGVLDALPDGAAVLIQKPMGEDLVAARRILEICQRKSLVAAVNFQLRFAPCVMAARELVRQGVIGDLHDAEVRVTCHMPWELWTFLFGIPRMEIVYHSIHYVDLIRSFLGEPSGVYCRTVKHPKQIQLASTRTTIALDYGEARRATITTNHGHEFGLRHQESYLKLEGTEGAVYARLGVNLDYPRGLPDELEYCRLGPGKEAPRWTTVSLTGNWFPHAFVGTMASLMRRAAGETNELPTSVEDAFRTMAVVEACYQSNEGAATRVPGVDE